MPEAFPGAIITFPMLGESFSLNPSGTYTLFGHTFYWYGAIIGLGFTACGARRRISAFPRTR